MTSSRSFYPFVVVFPVVYSISYLIAVEYNYALFTYHPAIEEFGALVQPPRDGPAMYWYGWMATAALVALFAAMIATFIPERSVRQLWAGWSWTIPIASMVAFGYILKGFFLR
jgi:hypothetical protein